MSVTAERASKDEQAAQSKTWDLLQFTVQKVHCCVHLNDVERVLLLMTLQPIPAGPDYLAGLLNLHGISVPVIDTGIRIGLDMPEKYDENTPVLLCANDERRLGLIVTEVAGVESVSKDDLQMRSDFDGIKAPLIAVIETEQRLSLMLDLPAIMEIDLSVHSSSLLPDPPE